MPHPHTQPGLGREVRVVAFHCQDPVCYRLSEVDRWIFSISLDTDAIALRPTDSQGAIGEDLGVSAMAPSPGKKRPSVPIHPRP
ncbi:hypothetical protein KZZ20_01265 [Methylacidiphilum fumariolicum]|uniref:Uncharacterized protein n=2 Tax=Candidatus Methylacidiphilum fumarolicum TaxID=591154 RepID=I0JXY2_METFB|nr:hypothetical protein [Candidatus Methylacidiphilum fumarolicum]MBW6414159.1 hypothetical protein [Candidatus Methylacidiphilum fumarolicum]CAI9086460.1 conserved protein of unknown function [Candidatus Methylacidiphilum fumarolicum]CCG92101.1 hypothetical protein MFUM_310022 [Methylacidiphilum fumariolicum SolV]